MMTEKHFEKIGILVIDLGSIDKAGNAIPWVVFNLAKQKHPSYYLTQISQYRTAVPYVVNALASPIIPSNPEALYDEALFVGYSRTLHTTYRAFLEGVITWEGLLLCPSTVVEERVRAAYHSRIVDVADNVRAAAIRSNLPEDQTVELGRQAALQEFGLTIIADRVTALSRDKIILTNKIILDALRTPVIEMTVEPSFGRPDWQEVSLVQLAVSIPIDGLNALQRSVLADLGIKGEGFTAVHHDQPSTWAKIESIRDVVTTRTFSTALPGGSFRDSDL